MDDFKKENEKKPFPKRNFWEEMIVWKLQF